jgi:hypothetical protein
MGVALRQTDIFEIGRRYRARADFSSRKSKFTAGEIVTFEQEGYVPYDEAYAFQFKALNGEEKFWTLRDDAPLDTWKQFFEPF